MTTPPRTREQVGSSFKPYVLSTAVSQGMDVQNSILNSSTYLCVAPDSTSRCSTPRRFRPRCITTTRTGRPSYGCKDPGAAKIQNDGGEAIGKPVGPKGDNLAETSVQNALAQSSNTAFTDLAHRATHRQRHPDGGQLRRRHSMTIRTARAWQANPARSRPSLSARPR